MRVYLGPIAVHLLGIKGAHGTQFLHCDAFHLQIHFEMLICGLHAGVAQPMANRHDVNPGLQQVCGRSVTSIPSSELKSGFWPPARQKGACLIRIAGGDN